MEHLRLRCKHCKREYVYCTYGNGIEYGTEEGCSSDYCGECQKAIDDALRVIPVKFKPILVEIDGSDIFPILDGIREEDEKKKNCIKGISVIPCGEFDNIDRYTHNGRTYCIKYNDDTPNDRHLFIEMEYDIFGEKVTDNYWKSDRYDDSYVHGRNIATDLRHIFENVSEDKIPEPDGRFGYMDFD